MVLGVLAEERRWRGVQKESGDGRAGSTVFVDAQREPIGVREQEAQIDAVIQLAGPGGMNELLLCVEKDDGLLSRMPGSSPVNVAEIQGADGVFQVDVQENVQVGAIVIECR